MKKCPYCKKRPLLKRSNSVTCGDKECRFKRYREKCKESEERIKTDPVRKKRKNLSNLNYSKANPERRKQYLKKYRERRKARMQTDPEYKEAQLKRKREWARLYRPSRAKSKPCLGNLKVLKPPDILQLPGSHLVATKSPPKTPPKQGKIDHKKPLKIDWSKVPESKITKIKLGGGGIPLL